MQTWCKSRHPTSTFWCDRNTPKPNWTTERRRVQVLQVAASVGHRTVLVSRHMASLLIASLILAFLGYAWVIGHMAHPGSTEGSFRTQGGFPKKVGRCISIDLAASSMFTRWHCLNGRGMCIKAPKHLNGWVKALSVCSGVLLWNYPWLLQLLLFTTVAVLFFGGSFVCFLFYLIRMRHATWTDLRWAEAEHKQSIFCSTTTRAHPPQKKRTKETLGSVFLRMGASKSSPFDANEKGRSQRVVWFTAVNRLNSYPLLGWPTLQPHSQPQDANR